MAMQLQLSSLHSSPPTVDYCRVPPPSTMSCRLTAWIHPECRGLRRYYCRAASETRSLLIIDVLASRSSGLLLHRVDPIEQGLPVRRALDNSRRR
eukprot:9468551-Pyramimonas_sp.AAC.1